SLCLRRQYILIFLLPMEDGVHSADTSSVVVAGLVAGLFLSQDRDWGLPSEVPLTPLAADRVFDDAAHSLNLDWQTQLDGIRVPLRHALAALPFLMNPGMWIIEM
ncbi:MAG: hypothetical protein ACP5I8_14765, partial [Phycisphaerae bacterium]